MDGYFPKCLRHCIPEEIKVKHAYIYHKKISTEIVQGLKCRTYFLEDSKYYCITDLCRQKGKLVHNYLRNKAFKIILIYEQKKGSHYPLVYVNNETGELRGTLLESRFIDNFLKWLNYSSDSDSG